MIAIFLQPRLNVTDDPNKRKETTMEAVTRWDSNVATDENEENICVIVTAAGRENLALRQLVRQAIPMVERPEDYPLLLRERLVRSLKTAVETEEETDEEASTV